MSFSAAARSTSDEAATGAAGEGKEAGAAKPGKGIGETSAPAAGSNPQEQGAGKRE